MVQNPAINDFEKPASQDLFEMRREVEMAYEPINPNSFGTTKSAEEVGQTVLDAANHPGQFDDLAGLSEVESLSPEHKLILMGMNIQAMRRNALKEGRLDLSTTAFSGNSNQAEKNFKEAA